MRNFFIPEISDGVFAVGARDHNRRLFDAFIPLPRGTSFNSYFIKGNDKTALIDTVGPGFESELLEKLRQLTNLSGLDYLVMNHAEPDHGSAIPHILRESQAKLVTSEKGGVMAARFYGVSPERIKTVKGGEYLELGGRTLNFVDVPWIHWLETMATYLSESRILFSCDFFGAHSAAGVYADDVENLISLAKGYFGEIMMPLRVFARKALEKFEALDIETIAPSHGPVHRDTTMIGHYRRWIAGETSPKAIMIYASMWGNTERMIEAVSDELAASGVDVRRHNLAEMQLDLLVEDLVDSRAIVIGASTVLSSLHPTVAYAMNLVKMLKPPTKYGAIFNSYGWGKGAAKQAAEFFESAKIENVGALEVNGPPSDEDYRAAQELSRALATKILAG